MSDVIAEVPAAGWYQDPNDDAAMRWWDGSTWTDHTQAIAPVTAPVPHRVASTEGSAGGEWESNYTDDELALYTGKPTELTSGSTTGRTMLEFSGTVPDWRRDRVTAQTGGAWLLAVSPLLWVIFNVFWTLIGQSMGLPVIPVFVSAPVLIVLMLLFAALDQRTLGARGIARPSLAFILLGPLGYLIARAVVVRRSGASGVGPLIMNIVAGLLLAVMVALSVVAGLFLLGKGASLGSDAVAQQRTEQAIESTLKSKGVTESVDCSGAKVQIVPNSTFHCVGTTACGTQQDIVVTLDAQGEMTFHVEKSAPPAPATP